MRWTRPESSARTMLGARRPRLRLVDFFVRMWLLKAWPHLNLPDAVLRNRLAAARLVLILIFAIALAPLIDYLPGPSGGSQPHFPSCSNPACVTRRSGWGSWCCLLFAPLSPRERGRGEGANS